jgi:hypothetical protein
MTADSAASAELPRPAPADIDVFGLTGPRTGVVRASLMCRGLGQSRRARVLAQQLP